MKKSIKKPVKKVTKRQFGGGSNPFGTTMNTLRPVSTYFAPVSVVPASASAIVGGYEPKTRQQRRIEFENLARTKAYEVPSKNEKRIGQMNTDATAKKIIAEYPGSRRKAIQLAESVTGLDKERITKYNPSNFKKGVRNVGSAIGSVFRGSGSSGVRGSNMCNGSECGQFKKGGTVKMKSMIPSGGAMTNIKTKKKK
jgi:hypothetical protein